MGRTIINDILSDKIPENASIEVSGWVRTRRDARDFSFLEINDGSALANLQVIAGESINGCDDIKNAHTGAAVTICGVLLASLGQGQKWELKADTFKVIGQADPLNYPLQKKRHSDEFLRDIAHLRARTNKFGAIFRLRSKFSWAVHDFFRERNFFHVHTPIITGSDCEGAGEMFQVTTVLDPKSQPSDDFFGKKASLTVSGQLEAELLALGLGKVYTFGPTFRAENSNTPRHAAEFWMIEPEVAFANLHDNMNLAEDLVKYVVSFALKEAKDDLNLFDRFVEPGLFTRLEGLINCDYMRLPYSEAINVLKSAKKKFEFAPTYGADIQTEHERFLTEVHFKKPVIIHDYPAA
ncbi:MAG: asparagine--tRNA ligase, partial [Candidatus Adiutrix sp.]